jgi:glycosyltransferase involved in cell wall biosynthesis
VLVVPSRWAEPSGLTLGEGLATGLPVIASRTGGIPEVLGSAGIMVEPNDPAELAAAIRRLVDDPGLRARLGREARAHAEAHDWGESWRLLRSVIQTET